MNRMSFWISTLFMAFYALSSTFFVVDQRQVGVIYSFGEIKRVITAPGMGWKLPSPIETIVYLDNRILTLDGPETGSIQTAEKKNLVVDWMVKWRISDAQQFIRNNGGTNMANLETRLSSIVQDALNTEVTKRTVRDVLATDREKIMLGVKNRLADDAKSFGIAIIDVRIKRVDFPQSVVESVYRRMQSERQQVASELRATGEAEGEQLRANAERQNDEIIAAAYTQAETIKGAADGKANQLYAQSFGKDPQFAHFYRSLEAYKKSINGGSDILVTDGSNDFFKTMRGGSTP